MRPVRLLVAYIAIVLLGGAMVAPWLYWSLQSLAAVFPALEELADNPFRRFLHRSLLILAAVGLWPLLRASGLDSWRDLGFSGPIHRAGRLLAGFGLGFAMLAVVALAAVSAGARGLNTDLSLARLGGRLLGAGVTAVVVSVLEEILFRGALFGILRKSCRWQAALVWSSAIYAMLHFFSRPDTPSEITWTSGLTLLPAMLRGFIDLESLVPGVFSLMLVGALLALAYQRTGNLYFSIGLHAGWIFWLRFYAVITQPAADIPIRLWGTGRLIDGWMVLLPLSLALIALLHWPLPETDRDDPTRQ